MELVNLDDSDQVFAKIFHVFATVYGLKNLDKGWLVLHDLSSLRLSADKLTKFRSIVLEHSSIFQYLPDLSDIYTKSITGSV